MPTTTFTPSLSGTTDSNPSPPGTWSDVHGGVNSGDLYSHVNVGFGIGLDSDNPDPPDVPTGWQVIVRGICLFDTSALGPSAHISSVKLTLFGYQNSVGLFYDTDDNPVPDFTIVGVSPGSTSFLSGNDYNNFGTTDYAPRTSFADIKGGTDGVFPGATFDFIFNATGIANVSLTGITKLGFRCSPDTDNAEPYILNAGGGYQVSTGFADGSDGSSDRWPVLTVVFERYWDVQPTAQTVTVSESVTVRIIDQINKSDTVTLTESVTITISAGAITPQISVNDSVTTSESVTPNLLVMPSVNDAITLTESIGRTIADTINVFDTATITESVTVRTTLTLSVSDTITLTESKTVNDVLTISQSDSVALAESEAVFAPFEGMPVLDQITVGEFVSLQIPLYLINVHDSITVTPVPIPDLINRPSVRQPVFVNEFVHVMIPLTINKSESITVSESKTVQNPELFGTVYDSVTHTESVTTSGQTVKVNVNEALTVSESVTRQNLTDTMSTSSAVGVAENVSVRLPNALTISVSESVAVASVASPSLTSYITVNDSVTHTESVTVGKTLFIVQSESITATENLTARKHLTFSVNDSVALAESKTITVSNFTTTNIKPHENISIAEYVLVIIRSEPDGAQGWNFSPDEGTLAKDSDWDFSHDEGVLAKDG